jgi:Tfp pilus assembly protein FimT
MRPIRNIKGARHDGHTLAEILIVAAVLAISAAVAIPSLMPRDTEKLADAASEVAYAFRYARAEAMRTGVTVGVNANALNNHLQVAKYTGANASAVLVHPVEKRPYDFDVSSLPSTQGVQLTSAGFQPYATATLIFDTSGSPFVYDTPGVLTYPLTSGTVVLSYAGKQLAVSIDTTGRVTIS